MDHTRTAVKQSKKKFNGYYLWGLAGLVPILGVIAGIIILVNAIIYYKDKWLALVGIADILFTFGFFFYLNHVLFPQMDEAKATLAQIKVNELVRDVAYYRKITGQYPDNLALLADSIENVDIYDPLHESADYRLLPYLYRKTGDTFLLYSPGIDGKPGTADDIYPTILSADGNKSTAEQPDK